MPLPPDLVLALRHIPPAVLTALAGWFGEHASSEQLTAARQRITELEQQAQRLRADLAARQEAHRGAQQRQREEESAQRARDQKAREAEGRQRTEAATKQIAELKDALWRLEAQSVEQAAALKQERDEHAYSRQSAIQQVAEYVRQVRQAVSDRESAQAEAQSLRKQLHAAQAPMALAVIFRQTYYNRPGRPYGLEPTWIVYGHRMDDASEALMQAELRLEIEKLRKKRRKAW
ncbi:MAG: hypothetical protein U1A78_18815 [Polyangia bacterium]